MSKFKTVTANYWLYLKNEVADWWWALKFMAEVAPWMIALGVGSIVLMVLAVKNLIGG